MMAPKNQYMLWTDSDLESLNILYQNGFSDEEIARILLRTPRAIKHAVNNLLIQETFHHGTRETAKKYGMSEDDMYTDIVPDKYYPYQSPQMSYCPIITIFFGFTMLTMITLYGSYDQIM